MNDESITGGTTAIVLVAVIMACLAFWSQSFGCQQRWARSGLQSHWDFGQGCLVQVPGGRWVPEGVVRETDLVGSR